MRRIVCAFALSKDFTDPDKKDELSESGEHRLYRLAVRLTSLFPSTLGHVKVYTEGPTLPNLHAHALIHHLNEQCKEHPKAQIKACFEEMEDFTDLDSYLMVLRELKSEAILENRVDTPIFLFSQGDLLGKIMDFYESAAVSLDYDNLMRYPQSEYYLASVIDFQTKKIDTITDSLLPRKQKAATD